MKKWTSVLLVLFCCTVIGVSLATGELREVEDHAGRTVALPAVIERVVVANMPPLTPVYCQFMGQENRLVGMPSNSIQDNTISHKIVPNLDNIATGFYAQGEINVEELAKLEPDVVLVSTFADHIELLERAGFTVIAFDVQRGGIDSLATVDAWYALLGQIFGMESQAKAISAYNIGVKEMIDQRLASIADEDMPTVLYLPWFTGEDGSMWTSPTGFVGEFYAQVTRAHNVGADASPNASLSVEEVAALNPSIIYLGSFIGSADEEVFYNSELVQSFWSDLNAVKNQQVYQLPGGFCNWFQPTADSALSLLLQAKINHPAAFEDVDMTQSIRAYYQDFYGVEIADEEIAAMCGEQ